MQSPAQVVESSQSGIHSRLPELVERHLRQPERKPLADHNRRAFELICQRRDEQPGPLVFDSFCGTGKSTALLAATHPHHLVIGIDKSAHRLNRHQGGAADNYLLVQADCEAVWRQALDRGWKLDHHYLLYPNPWPKPGQIKRRVHGNAAFPYLLGLRGRLELRTNWLLYAQEFTVALETAGHNGRIQLIEPQAPLTLFEEKYLHSGHQLWGCHADL